MSDAVGVHAHPSRKLGRKPPKRAPALRLAEVLTGTLAHPEDADHFSKVGNWVLGANDRYGTCGPTSVANAVLDVTAYLTDTPVVLSDDDVFDLYRRSGNPNFPQDDNGVDMQTMLEALKAGGIGGRKPIAFAAVDPNNRDEVLAAVAIFGGLLFGVTLEMAQQAQTDQRLWDYRASGLWGGHAIYCGRYKDPAGTSDDRTGVITWAEIVDMTDAFVERQLDEAWVVIWPEHLGSRAFQEGVDLDALAAAYKQLTGDDLPLPEPPAPAPEPAPAPAPEPPAPPVPAPPTALDLAGIAEALADRLAELMGEPAHKSHSDRHHEGKLIEVFFEAGGIQIGVMDKR